MTITRIYADAQGESRFEELAIALEDSGAIGQISPPVPARALMFRETPASYDYDWHVAPRRQVIVLLDGVIQIEVSSGEQRVFRGGDLLLVEDTTGRGHRTRHLEAKSRRSLFVVLEDQAAIPTAKGDQR